MIILISGFISSGKDTVGNYLVTQHGFTKLSFAATLKDIIAVMFNWDRSLLEGDTQHSRQWREEIDHWWAEKLQIPNFTPRFALQYIGTDVLRCHFCDSIWILAIENKLRKLGNANIVITDCRYPNERIALKDSNACSVQVKRGHEPNWVPVAKLAANGDDHSISKMKEAGVHTSEYAWINTAFDYTIDNNDTIDTLYEKVDRILADATKLPR